MELYYAFLTNRVTGQKTQTSAGSKEELLEYIKKWYSNWSIDIIIKGVDINF